MGYLDGSSNNGDDSPISQAQPGSGGYLGAGASDGQTSFRALAEQVSPQDSPVAQASGNGLQVGDNGSLNYRGIQIPSSPSQLPVAEDENSRVQRILSKIDPSQLTGDFMQGFWQAEGERRANMASNAAQTRENVQEMDEQRALTTQNGMQQAAQMGGFNGVIDYLKVSDPVKAMQFIDAKNNMDQNMMKTDVMRALQPAQIGQAMIEGYGVIGKMGSAILNAPDADKAALYQQIKPILQTVLGKDGTPDVFNADAVHTLMLGAAQASPSNDYYALQKSNGLANTTTNQLFKDIATLQSQGATVDNSPHLATLVMQARASQMTAQQTGVELGLKQNALQVAQANQQAGGSVDPKDVKTITDIQHNLQSQMDSQLKPHTDWFNNVSNPIHIALDDLQAHPDNFHSQVALGQAFTMATQRGKTGTDLSAPAYQGSGWIGEMQKKAAFYDISSPSYGKMPDGNGGWKPADQAYVHQMAFLPEDIKEIKQWADAGDKYHTDQTNYVAGQFKDNNQKILGNLSNKVNIIYPEQYRNASPKNIDAQSKASIANALSKGRPDIAQQIADYAQRLTSYVTPSK